MENELKNQVEAVQTPVGGLLAVEQFLQNHYLFRRNVLSGKIECATLPAGDETEYRELTPEAEMSIIIRARKELVNLDELDAIRPSQHPALKPTMFFLCFRFVIFKIICNFAMD